MISSDLAVLRGLAANPATPVPVLLSLAAHPMDGPVAALLGRESLPPQVAEVLAGRAETEIRRRLAGHPATPAEFRTALAADPEPAVRTAVAAWPDSWTHLMRPLPANATFLAEEVYRALAADPEVQVRSAIGLNSALPEEIRALLAEDPDPGVRRNAAYHGLPLPVLHRLMADAEPKVRQAALDAAVRRSPGSTFPAELAEGFQQDSGYHQDKAWSHTTLTPPVLARLLAEPDRHEALARNPSLPPERMRAFLADPSLHLGLAENPALPEPLLEQLIACADPWVLREVLYRRELPDRLRRWLPEPDQREEPFPYVRSLSPSHASLAERLSYLDHPNTAFRHTLAQAGDLPADAVRKLAEDQDFGIRLMICETYSDVPPAVLVEVAENHGGHSLAADLVPHPLMPAEAVARFAGHEYQSVRMAVAARADLALEPARRLLADPHPEVRKTAAANPRLPIEEIRRLLADPDPVLRQGAAANPGLPADELARLAGWGA